MTRYKFMAGLALVSLALFAAWELYSFWFAPKKYPIVIPPKPAIHAEWPVIDGRTKTVVNSWPCPIPRTNEHFLLKVKLKNVPDPKNGIFIVFCPARGTEDAKKNWYY